MGGESRAHHISTAQRTACPEGTTDSRLIKTNCVTSEREENFSIFRFKQYLKDRESVYLEIAGINKKTNIPFTFRKDDIHRWKDGYLKKRLAKLYKLRDWYENQSVHEVSMLTLTVPHNENIWGVVVNTGHNVYEAWENLKQGWSRFRTNRIIRKFEYVLFYEPHKTGYPHAHIMIFGTLLEDEIDHLKKLWSRLTGANEENGFDVKPGIGVEHIISYLMKYMEKTLYHSLDTWTRGELLFNAIAHEKGYRLFGSSNTLAKIMRLDAERNPDNEALAVSLTGLPPRFDGDVVLKQRVWSGACEKMNSPLMEQRVPESMADRISRWMLKTGEEFGYREIKFRNAPRTNWLKYEKKRQKEFVRKYAEYVMACP
jgi:hypothetical protein